MKTCFKFYKVIALDDKNHCEEAINKQQIHMTNYIKEGKVNDVCEGYYWHDNSIEQSYIDKLRYAKQSYLIGCASKRLRNSYMWEKFANNGKGICLAFTCVDEQTKHYKMQYIDNLPILDSKMFDKLSLDKQVQYVLLHKKRKYMEEEYEKEEEIRFLKKSGDDDYMSIAISTIYLGWNMCVEERQHWMDVAKKQSIKVINLHKTIL